MDLGWVRRMSCDGFEGRGGPGRCRVMDLGWVRRMSCDGFGRKGWARTMSCDRFGVGQEDVM